VSVTQVLSGSLDFDEHDAGELVAPATLKKPASGDMTAPLV
jgi:hypothetical protein